MKLLFLVLVSIAIVSALPKEEGTTRCNIGPFTMEARQCNCASDGKHFTCNESGSLPMIEGEMNCVIGPFTKPLRYCHCASDGQHYTCPETKCDPGSVISRGAQKCHCSHDGNDVVC